MKLKNLAENLILLVILIAAFGATFLILFDFSFSGKIYPRVSAAGLDIGYFEPKNAQWLVENKIALWRSQKIRIDYQDPSNAGAAKKWQVETEEIGITPSASKTILMAYNAGRTGNPFKTVTEKIKIITGGKNLLLYYDLNENRFNSYLSAKFSFLEKPPQNAALAFADGSLVEIPAENGYTIDRHLLKNQIIADTQNLENRSIPIKLASSAPKITSNEIQQAKKQASALLENKVSLKFENKSWMLDKEWLKSALKFEPEIEGENGNKSAIGLRISRDPAVSLLEKIQLEVNREARNAVLGVKDDKVIIESGGETGVALSIDDSAKKIAEEMLAGAAENKKNIGIQLVARETEPDIGQKTLEKMNINALLGQGKSNFAGSPKNRRYNIGVGAAKFNNIFIAPDEEFSFNKILGDVDAKSGYLPELVIKEDKTVPEYGGGLCQVSTTTFRAAIYAGLPILERRPHSYPVVYYNPQGMDATIYPPHPDLRFKNDTGGTILVQTKIVKNELIFNFFGTKQKRVVKIIGPNVYDKKPDGSMKAVFWREFYEGGKLTKKEPFYSSYSSPANFPHKNPLE